MYNALIKTHHITSRKKIAQLKKTAEALSIYALLRVGGTPGVMYVEGSEEDVKEWVGTVHVRPPDRTPNILENKETRLISLDRTFVIKTTSL